jgi:hypothetical protein
MTRRSWPLALAAVTLSLFASLVAQADAAKPHKRCLPRGSHVVARHGRAVIYLRNTGPDDGEYGAPSSLFGCRSTKRAPHRLVDFPDGDSPTFARLGADGAKARFTGNYVAFSLNYIDIVCSKYAQDNCTTSITASYDLRSGRRRGTAQGPATTASASDTGFNAADIALTTGGWFAWIPAPASSPQPLFAADSGGQRALDPGPIEPGSLAASGNTVSWTSGGQAHSATLH